VEEEKRFRKVFPPVEGVELVTTLPGNHDIGIGDGIKEERLQRFEKYFSHDKNSTSQVLETCGFQFVLLDSPSLLNTENPAIHLPPKHFLDTLPSVSLPRLLFTHIPLYRPPDTYCGPYRESPRPISLSGGYQYQNTLPEHLSTEILDKVTPLGVFTGDDHDSCIVHHDGVPEYTVKSFSFAMVGDPRRTGIDFRG
jgi:ethanolamine phosphate phosphodiesterase